jgi:hypothetical protein
MSNRRRRRPREDWDHWDREIAIVPNTGALGSTGQPAEKSAPTITPLGLSRQVRAFVIRCEWCPWESDQEASVGACELRLLSHAHADHPGSRADTVDVRIRSRKYHFPIETIEL